VIFDFCNIAFWRIDPKNAKKRTAELPSFLLMIITAPSERERKNDSKLQEESLVTDL